MSLPAPSLTAGTVEELAKQSGLEPPEIAHLIERAVVDAYRRFVSDDAGVHARVDLETGSYEIYRRDEGGGETRLALQGEFVRQAVHAAKQAVSERLREREKDRVMLEASRQHGQLIDTIVERSVGSVWYLRAGDMTAILPPEEQMPGERLRLHQHLKVVVLDARRRFHDAVVVVSRAHPLLLRLLLEQEVPEVPRGQVIVRGLVREAGRRSKIAVEAGAEGIDPQGACIGPKGIRHRAITSALGEEQVQIIAWSADEAEYVGNALAPARVSRVELDAEARTATVTVAPDQLSLAIGRGGENARLAARLTGWRIDISAGG
ncbi:MAG TPA: transcription termination/antitermination protein NusA [Candidatus Sulfotelmatobacter sp.]|nr:transcription termination/antitermination protein NusA [Candidatus Sulfotelmatobacter sp.]